MKCRVIRDDLQVSPAYVDDPRYEGQIEFREVRVNHFLTRRPFFKKGAIVEHPEAYMLVRQGCAVPADEACAVRAARTPEEQAEAQHAYQRLSHGILPEDFDKYDQGMIEGYNPDGSFIPGPNYHLLVKKESTLFLPDDFEDDEE